MQFIERVERPSGWVIDIKFSTNLNTYQLDYIDDRKVLHENLTQFTTCLEDAQNIANFF